MATPFKHVTPHEPKPYVPLLIYFEEDIVDAMVELDQDDEPYFTTPWHKPIPFDHVRWWMPRPEIPE